MEKAKPNGESGYSAARRGSQWAATIRRVVRLPAPLTGGADADASSSSIEGTKGLDAHEGILLPCMQRMRWRWDLRCSPRLWGRNVSELCALWGRKWWAVYIRGSAAGVFYGCHIICELVPGF